MAREDRDRWDAKHAARADPDAAPAPFLVQHAHRLPVGRTLDVAAGSGRNARFLAGLGHCVVAVDVSAVGLAALRSVAPRVACVQMDLDRPGIRPSSCDAVVVVSFLDRRLFDAAVDWLRPGGVVLWDSFRRAQGEARQPRNPAWLLEPGELRARLSPRCEVLAEREGLDGEALRSGIVARRRS